MKIVTYNVNGLKQRVAQHGSLLKLLNSLDADIICFQETKLSRRDLSVDLTTAEGYEAFVSCTRTSSKGRCSYSGVATFCHVNSAFSSDEVVLPLAAEEGFTGTLEPSIKGSIMTRDILNDMPIVVEGENLTREDLVKVDSEGRCIITDHGHFVLFNLYGPRAEDDDKERLRFKEVFFKVLQRRWEFLISKRKRLFVVGDLNIAPSAIDRCDAQSGFEENKFRKWLRSMLQEGPFVDVFREKHPDRKEAYTCFPQSVGGEEFNYGSRIDHILISGPCMHQNYCSEGHSFSKCHVEECDIMVHLKRGFSDNAPRWSGGRAVKLEGSDHIPVYVIVEDLPRLQPHNTPPSAVRYYPEVRGVQQRIVSFLMSGETSSSPKCQVSEVMGADKNGIILHETENSFKAKSERFGKLPQSKITSKKKARHETCSQLTLRSFFQNSKLLPTSAIGISNVHENASPSVARTGVLEDELPFFDEADNYGKTEDDVCEKSQVSTASPLVEDVCDLGNYFSSQEEKNSTTFLVWQCIQQKMKTSIPLCKGHREPCVARSVKKNGPNIGRQFYVCARAKGPASNPKANCNHFEWAYSKPKKGQR